MSEKTLINEQQALERFTQLFREMDTLREDMKALQEEVDENSQLDVKAIKKAAALLAKEKYETFRVEAGAVLSVLERAGM